MIKIVIYKYEGVILSDDLLRFKYYELLWHYLRRLPEWKDFDQVLRLRNLLVSRMHDRAPYLTIAKRYLSARDFERYQLEIKWFTRKHSGFYLRLIPGMRTIVQNTKYYYKLGVLSHLNDLFKRTIEQFNLKKTFNYQLTKPDGEVPRSSFILLKSFLEKNQALPEETIIISNRPDTEIEAANRLGIITVHAKYNLRTRGVAPHHLIERKYFEATERTPDVPTRALNPRQIPDAVVERPEEISRMLQQFEEGRKQEQSPEREEETVPSFWDIAREIMNPQGNWEQK